MIEGIILTALVVTFFMILLGKWKIFEWMQLKFGWSCEFCFAFWLSLIATTAAFFISEMEIIEMITKVMGSTIFVLIFLKWLR